MDQKRVTDILESKIKRDEEFAYNNTVKLYTEMLEIFVRRGEEESEEQEKVKRLLAEYVVSK